MLRRPWWAWCLAGAALLTGGYAWTSPEGLGTPWTLVQAATLVVILAAGWIALGLPTQRANGRLLLLFAVAVAANSLYLRHDGANQFVYDLLDPFDDLLVLVLLLRWPRERLQTRAQVLVSRLAFAVYPVLQVVEALAFDPAEDPSWDYGRWPTLLPGRALHDVLLDLKLGFALVMLVVYLTLLAARVRSAGRPERRELVPVVAAAAALVADKVVSATYFLTERSIPDWVGALEDAAFGLIPLTFLGAMAIRRVQRALAVESLLRPEQPPTPEWVRQALARALGDSRLGLALYAPDQGGFVGADGAPVGDTPPDRFGMHVPAADGRPLARIDLHRRLAGRPELTEPVVRAAAVALDHARLQAELRAQLREADESRLRLEQARLEGERLSRLLPGGLAEKLRADPGAVDRTERLTVTVVMSDVRGYTGIAERTEPAALASQLNQHRRAMNAAILAEGGTVMQYVGDAVMAVFGAPFPLADHADRALRAAAAMHRGQAEVNATWAAAGLEPFGLGIGLSTGEVAAALLGSEERVEYTLVGDTVNLAQRLQNAARPAGTTVVSLATVQACDGAGGTLAFEELPPLAVKGRAAPVRACLVRSPGTASLPARDLS